MRAYLVSGRMNDVYLKMNLQEADDIGAHWYPELQTDSESARMDLVSSWRPLSMWSIAPAAGRNPEFADAIGYGGIRGISTFVSDRARVSLEPLVSDECAFL